MAKRDAEKSAPQKNQKPKRGTLARDAGASAPSSDGPLTKIPSITALMNAAIERDPFSGLPRSVVTAALRETVDALRLRLKSGEASAADCDITAVLSSAKERIRARHARRLTRVINATGVVLHTGLGRSVLPRGAVERLTAVAGGYCNLEIDLDTGERGLRGGYVEELLRDLTGAEAALVVNNNAAATMLALRTLAAGREVIVSRGQLIEIGGSYRLPDVMAAGGAILREIGTTNKTHMRDYKTAISERTGLIMQVHTSNFRVVGFSQTPSTADLAELAHSHNLPLFDDLGSGALLDDAIWKAADEPTVRTSLAAGADLIAFSGDKLLGGPQAGILAGRREIIDRLRKDPMARALRIGKLTMAALEAVLEIYADPAAARREIPLLRSLSEPEADLMSRAESLASAARKTLPGETFTVAPDEGFAGGGSLPDRPFPTAVVRWTPKDGSVDAIARKLRTGDPSVLVRINEGAIVLDVRTIDAPEIEEIVAAIKKSRTE